MNTRKTTLATLLAALTVSPLALTPVSAQYSQHDAQVQAPATHVYARAELDQMLAPIALYPDALLSQVLMAATYPIEVAEAARWSRSHPRLHGDDAVRAVHNEDWDPSVQSLVAFPQILQRMDENIEWTRTLGDAFLAQEAQMMDRVQLLRQRARAAGHLHSSEQIRVEHQGPVIVVRQASPEYIYVPYYDPMEAYGTWMWPAYRPVAWSPWPGYSRGYRRPGTSVGFWWGRPVGLSVGFFFGDFDWNRRHTHVAHSNSYYYRAPAYSNRSVTEERGHWQHDPQHRRAVAYRDSEVRQRFASVQTERREAAREERRDERQFERRMERQAAPAAIATPTQPAVQQRAERREESRAERREDRREERQAGRQQAQPAATLQAQPQAVTPTQRVDRRDESRTERREDRRAERQAAPMPTPVQPAALPRAEQRDDRRAERQAAMEAQRQARQQAQQQQAQESQRQAHAQAQAAQRQAQDAQRQAQQQAQQQAQETQRQAQDAQRQAQQQAQQQARQAQQQARQPQPAATMPAALAPQTPRAERQEQREERREKRKERREEKG